MELIPSRRVVALAALVMLAAGCSGQGATPGDTAADGGAGAASDAPQLDVGVDALEDAAVAQDAAAADTFRAPTDAMDAEEAGAVDATVEDSGPFASDASDTADVPDVPDPPDAATSVADTSALADTFVADSLADSLAGDAAAGAPTTFTAPLASADQIRRLFNLHQLAANQSLFVADKLYGLGDASCPGVQTATVQSVKGLLEKTCAIVGSGKDIQLDGRMEFEVPNVCKGSTSKLYAIETKAFQVLGTLNGAPIDLAFDLVYQSDTVAGVTTRSWTGSAHYGAAPNNWFLNVWTWLQGVDVHGWDVQWLGDSGVNGALWTGVLDVAGEGSVQFTTPQKVLTAETASGCYVPNKGQVVLHGAVDAVVTFDSKGVCANPTWTRAGVEMGELKLDFWGSLTLCGAAK